jgi:hypothetical protein
MYVVKCWFPTEVPNAKFEVLTVVKMDLWFSGLLHHKVWWWILIFQRTMVPPPSSGLKCMMNGKWTQM